MSRRDKRDDAGAIGGLAGGLALTALMLLAERATGEPSERGWCSGLVSFRTLLISLAAALERGEHTQHAERCGKCPCQPLLVSRNPITPPTISAALAMRQKPAGSFCRVIPTTKVPTAPIPVQTA